MIARVLVDVPAKAVDKLFDYLVPEVFSEVIEVGMRVKVPFGPRQLQGYCLELADSSNYADLKPIIAVLDIESYLTPELIAIMKELHEETATVMIRIIETILPSALKATYKTKISVKDQDALSLELKSEFKDRTYRYLEELTPFLSEVKSNVKKGILIQETEIKNQATARTERVVCLGKRTTGTITKKQQDVIDVLMKEDGILKIKELASKANVTPSVISTLERNGYVEIKTKEKYRDLFSLAKPLDKHIKLNDRQKEALQKIAARLGSSQTFLLHGVTGSGKTEVYLEAIEKVVSMGKEAIVLVPEIALTPMMVSRFISRFPNQLAILHSGLSHGEKFDEWRKIIRKEVKIVVGARSACFAPFTNLGLIVVDEFHETTYKQEEPPKYNAIDILSMRSLKHHAPLVLGSATPSIDAYARFKRGYYELLELPERAQNATLPELEIIDMKQEFKSGNTGIFSRRLIEELDNVLKRKEQALLLMNRRGYSTFVICRNCGYVFSCPDCDISLTYHEADHTLKCHYCNHKEPLPKKCAKCGSEELRYFGSGTQKIEAEIQKLFSSAKIVRMDTDTTRTKNAHEILLHDFEYSGDILLGTQMIAKGLDFPNVTLVGIIQADGNLYSPDFRAPEKTFQLITQVSGRAGRREKQGKVIVQAFNPNHYAIRYAINQDYLGFYEYEMRLRKIARYTPFYYLTQVMFAGEKMRDLFMSAKEAVNMFRKELSEEAIVLGPSLPIVSRIKGKYYCQVIIKYRNEPKLNQTLIAVRDLFDTEHIRVTIDRSPTLG
ncbi:MAG: primosomal protein N' [Candidatus Izemoplasmatales bacterium]|nr:primosomal protein N' [Candidatus Izemoplasmatales bacterium]